MIQSLHKIVSLCGEFIVVTGGIGILLYLYRMGCRKYQGLMNYFLLAFMIAFLGRLVSRIVSSRYNYSIFLIFLIFSVYAFWGCVHFFPKRKLLWRFLALVCLVSFMILGIAKTFRHDRKAITFQEVISSIRESPDFSNRSQVVATSHVSNLRYYLYGPAGHTDSYDQVDLLNDLLKRSIRHNPVYVVLPYDFTPSGASERYLMKCLRTRGRKLNGNGPLTAYEIPASAIGCPPHPVSVMCETFDKVITFPDDGSSKSKTLKRNKLTCDFPSVPKMLEVNDRWNISYGDATLDGLSSRFHIGLVPTQGKRVLLMETTSPGRIGIHSDATFPLTNQDLYWLDIVMNGTDATFAEIPVYLFSADGKYMYCKLISTHQLNGENPFTYSAVIDRSIADNAAKFRIGCRVVNGKLKIKEIILRRFSQE